MTTQIELTQEELKLIIIALENRKLYYESVEDFAQDPFVVTVDIDFLIIKLKSK